MAVPLSVEAVEFSLMTRVPTEEGSDSSGNCVPSREIFFCINFIYFTRITHALKALGVLLNSDIYICMCTKISHTHIRY